MKRHREPEAVRELHKIREQIHQEAVAVGIGRYYEELNRRSEWLRAARKKSPAVVRERAAKYKTR
jgi:hypothetical protein